MTERSCGFDSHRGQWRLAMKRWVARAGLILSVALLAICAFIWVDSFRAARRVGRVGHSSDASSADVSVTQLFIQRGQIEFAKQRSEHAGRTLEQAVEAQSYYTKRPRWFHETFPTDWVPREAPRRAGAGGPSVWNRLGFYRTRLRSARRIVGLPFMTSSHWAFPRGCRCWC